MQYPSLDDLGIQPVELWRAHKRIRPLVHHTPLLQSRALSTGDSKVYLKLDYLQEPGSFKIRGAANKLLSLSDEEQQRGVTTFSTGNHGLAVSYVAQQLGVRAVVCISRGVPQNKVDALHQLGAEVEVVGESQDEAGVRSYELQDQEGLTVIPPFDDPMIIYGQGTLGIELIEDDPDVDTVLVPLSGGGLMSGVALALKTMHPGIQIVGVTMDRGAAMVKSLQHGSPIEINEVETLADSLRGGIGLNNKYTFPMVRELMDDAELVTEDEIAEAMRILYHQHKIVVEGAAAATVALLLKKREKFGSHIACLLTGNNVDTTMFGDIILQG